ncbi:eukaryotic translation initiation factor 4G-like isoform X1 [Vigna unguiculata]|uniref:eukaryotic translation initiation factor 4G-like isoform X1 n=1 Tax=Vigna unguiculata TaxID=3917 RepID=UPI0010163BD9|nr:eukaryotic translation initiation factor 4G-like isoform X1 [Vigna unguiculata]
MSFNQSKVEKNDVVYRRNGRSSTFNQQRGSYGKAGGDGGGIAPSNNSLSTARSFNKKSNNAQGGQSRLNPSQGNSTESNNASAARIISNGIHLHGAPDGPITKSSESSAGHKSTGIVPKAETASLPPLISDPVLPTSLAKGDDESKAFPFQFGSIVPGVINGMAIPARTSSAPPSFDKQKPDQALDDSDKSVSSDPIPPVPKQQNSHEKDAGVNEQSNIEEIKANKDSEVSNLTSVNQISKPFVAPVTGISMSTSYHQSQAPLQFGGANPQIQSQGMTTTSIQMPIPMPLPIGNATQVQQPVFIPGLQPHPMHPQGIMHQGQNISYSPQMGNQLGNMGIGIGCQYPQQQGGKFAGPRKTTHVKITHPETHEELRLDKRMDAYSNGGSSGVRPHPIIPSQSQPVKSFPASHPMNYFSSNSYNTNSPYYPPNSLPLTSGPMTPNCQPPTFNFPLHHGPQGVSFMNLSSQGSLPTNKTSTPTGITSMTIKPNGTTTIVDSSLSNSCIADVQNGESPGSTISSETFSEVSPQRAKFSSDFVADVSSNEGGRESLGISNSLKDKNPGKKDQISQNQVSVRSPTMDTILSGVVDQDISDVGLSNALGIKKNNSAAITIEDLPRSDTTSTGVEVVTNGSVEASAYASVEGCGAQAIDKVHNQMPDKTYKLVEGNFGSSDLQSTDLPKATLKHVKNDSENVDVESGTKDRPIIEPNKMKNTSKGKKKRREILQKADAAGSTSDLYNAYKGPGEKRDVLSSENKESVTTSLSMKQFDVGQSDIKASEKCDHNKVELDDWEDVAEMSTPKLEVHDISQNVGDGHGSTTKKYSRDFLLKFVEQCIDLPEGFEITADIGALMNANVGGSHIFERDSHPSPGRAVGGLSRMDRRGDVVMEDDRWNKVSGSFRGRGPEGTGGNSGFRFGHGGNFGVLRSPRAQTPLQYGGGILSGPMQSGGNQGGRNNPNGERWQRSASYQQRGLIPSPNQTPLQIMHKAENKYEVGKVTDVEEVKQRQLKAILNKLTPQNFDKLFEQVKEVNIDNAITLIGVISQIFEKALMEPTFCEMYANFCLHLASELPDFSEDNEKITFKRLLLNKCQEEFERGEREEEEANKADEGEVKQSTEEREERRVKARRRMLGNIRLIGELYKKKMLTERIMHECIKKLLGQYQDPDEENIEALCKLMSTIGEMIDHPKAKEHMDAYFERMKLLSINMNLSSRVRFMLKDAIDLRKNKWQQRRKVEGPKKIEEVHRDAAQERQSHGGRSNRGPGNNQSSRRNPIDFSPRVPSSNSQMGGLCGLPTQARGYGGSQDAQFEEQQSYEAKTLSVPLPQRSLGDDSITLVPQGGLARGMSMRGSTTISNLPMSDVVPLPRDPHIMTAGLNAQNNSSERTQYNSMEDLGSRHGTNRSLGPSTHDQSIAPEHNVNHGNRNLRSVSPAAQLQGSIISQNAYSDKILSEEQLRDMSLSAIREYYSARDENELVLCVKDLNSPSFYPSMVSLWVTDSFERKDTERDLLTKLLINLVKSQHHTLNQVQLIKGFESVLCTLEDVVNDAPRAAEFLGRIFAKIIIEKVATFTEIAQLIHDGGEEPGSLLEIGLAGDVLGSTLEVIQNEKGDVLLNEILSGSSNFQLKTFQPPNAKISRKLEKFI